jgi:hypothetical protein
VEHSAAVEVKMADAGAFKAAESYRLSAYGPSLRESWLVRLLEIGVRSTAPNLPLRHAA